MKTIKPKSAPVKQLIDLVALAAHFEVTTRGIQKWVELGLFPQPMRIGRRLRWTVDDINQWIEAGCPPVRKRSK